MTSNGERKKGMIMPPMAVEVDRRMWNELVIPTGHGLLLIESEYLRTSDLRNKEPLSSQVSPSLWTPCG
jgi:hypothetical protein